MPLRRIEGDIYLIRGKNLYLVNKAQPWEEKLVAEFPSEAEAEKEGRRLQDEKSLEQKWGRLDSYSRKLLE